MRRPRHFIAAWLCLICKSLTKDEDVRPIATVGRLLPRCDTAEKPVRAGLRPRGMVCGGQVAGSLGVRIRRRRRRKLPVPCGRGRDRNAKILLFRPLPRLLPCPSHKGREVPLRLPHRVFLTRMRLSPRAMRIPNGSCIRFFDHANRLNGRPMSGRRSAAARSTARRRRRAECGGDTMSRGNETKNHRPRP
jgi:hypothetical protein